MTRLIVGPFNRVEGDLEIALDIEDDAVVSARVTVPLYRGFEQILVGRPGGTTRALDLGLKTQLIGVIRDFRRFLETVLFAAPLGDVLDIETPEQLASFAEGSSARGDFSAFLRIAHALELERLGGGANALMSYGAYRGEGGAFLKEGIFDPETGALSSLDAAAIREDVAHAWMRDGSDDPATAKTEPHTEKPDAYSWAKAPRLMGRPAEVGAIARLAVHGHPLIRALLARSRGSNVMSRVTARLIELALLADTAESWAKGLALSEPFCVPAPTDAEGQSFGLVEAARGSLGHWMSARKGKIRNYQIIAPTTWNFSPRDAQGVAGPVEQGLAGAPLAGLGARAATVQHVVRSFDPCMVCTAH